MKDNPSMSANATFDKYGNFGTTTCNEGYSHKITGLTKREAFAMAAMQGLLANSEPNSWSEEQWYSNFSKQAVNHADALLKELAK